MKIVLNALIISLICMGLSKAEFSDRALYSLNNYGEGNSGRCVLNMGNRTVYLDYGQQFELSSLPCTSVLCMGDGWGTLLTCYFERPPDYCYYSDFKWNAPYPSCCDRTVICDENYVAIDNVSKTIS